MPLVDTEAEEMLEACEGSSALTDWESNFLASIRAIADAEEDRTLTASQISKLKQIHAERCT